MNKIEAVELFDRKSGSLFILFLLFVTSLSLSWEYFQFTEFKRFDDPLVRAEVIDQEVRLVNDLPKTSMKLRLDNGSLCRCVMSPNLRDLRGREILVELQVAKVSFLDYFKGFRSRGSIQEVYPLLSLKERWYRSIAQAHDDQWMKELYGALFVATPMSQELQILVGAMGLSHILSISGYHFGILSIIAFFFLRPLYRWAQERYFPYRHSNRDLFFIGVLVLIVWGVEYFYFCSLLGTLEALADIFGSSCMVLSGDVTYLAGYFWHFWILAYRIDSAGIAF